MTNEEFKQLLKKAGLNKKEFAKVANISYNTIRNWNNVPSWVMPFIQNYIKAKTLDNVKDVVCDEVKSSNITSDKSSPVGEKDE
ncbi:helix-turn-helix domain-containing protein [Nitrosophilus labii]|uniref:helix-turn-helix domain-containing protein n=1 Tax=Nitrosophilus labii TaxID=2706014 RepID=UPI0016570932|nr:helix-turn-helix domain-containing protein [Nitrosophilus labii]